MKRSFECPKAATFRLRDFKKCQKLALLSLEVDTVLRYSLLRFRAIVIFGQDRYIFKKKFWLLDKFITCPIDIFWRTFSTNNVETRQRYRQEAVFRTHIIFYIFLKIFSKILSKNFNLTYHEDFEKQERVWCGGIFSNLPAFQNLDGRIIDGVFTSK